jgi:hypothetical protein
MQHIITPPPSPAANTRSAGRLHAFRVRWLGDRDPVETQLADIARQGARMAHVAHACAAALLILFSAASFVALGGDTFAEIQARWSAAHELNVAAAISLSVITLMVLAFDVGMLYAASMLRLLATRRAGLGEQWVHVLVMVSVAAIEAATYMYMAWRYEHPATALAWALIGVRAAAAPLLAVYLSMARPLPVTARDILAQAELASGAGVIRDVVREAQDTSAPLADKIALYGASAVMAAPDRARLEGMLAVVQRRQDASIPADIGQRAPTDPEHPEPRPPTGPGSPAVQRPAHPQLERANGLAHAAGGAGTVLTLPTVRTLYDEPPTPAARPAAHRGNATKGRKAAKRAHGQHTTRAERSAAVRERRETQVAEWLAEDPRISTRELIRRLRTAEHTRRISESTVSELWHVVEARQEAYAASQAGPTAVAQ